MNSDKLVSKCSVYVGQEPLLVALRVLRFKTLRSYLFFYKTCFVEISNDQLPPSILSAVIKQYILIQFVSQSCIKFIKIGSGIIMCRSNFFVNSQYLHCTPHISKYYSSYNMDLSGHGNVQEKRIFYCWLPSRGAAVFFIFSKL